MYAMLGTRPDIAYAVSLVSRYRCQPDSCTLERRYSDFPVPERDGALRTGVQRLSGRTHGIHRL